MAFQGLKEMAGTKSPKFGHFIVEFATPGIGHILKSAGCDFVLFDLEHSGFDFETVKSAIRYFEAARSAGRSSACPRKEYHHIARAMDMGAEGLMLPMVGSADEARHIVNSMKYYPEGKRGVALQVAHDRYRPGSVADKFTAANKRTHALLPDRDGRGRRRTPTRSRPSTASTASGSAISTSRSRSASPASSTTKNFTDGDRHDRRRREEAQEGARAGWCPTSRRASSSTRWASISSAIPAMSGCCTTRLPRRSASSATAASRNRGAAMADKFRVALSGDFKKADGSPTYPDFDLAPLAAAPGVEMAFLESGEPDPRRAARGFRRAHPACPSLRAGERAEERPARRRRALRRRLRHRRRRCLHQGRHRAGDHARRRAPAGRRLDHHASCWR